MKNQTKEQELRPHDELRILIPENERGYNKQTATLMKSRINQAYQEGIQEERQRILKEIEPWRTLFLETLDMIGCDKKDKGFINNRIEELKSKIEEKK